MSGGSSPAARTVRCPRCGGPSVYAPANGWRPFCSARCRQADLGAWADEAYRVPESAPPDPGAPEDRAAGPAGAHPI
jgi:hypothetical protein